MMKKKTFHTMAFSVLLLIISLPVRAAVPGPGTHEMSMEYGGLERNWLLHVPAGYDGSAAVPLVISLHGGGANPEHQMKTSRMNEKADAEGFIVAYPAGTGAYKNALLTWNSGRCCGSAKKNEVDDVGFIRELIDRLRADYNIDPERVYATGFSNGGMMAHRLACELSSRIAAIGVVAGALDLDEDAECAPEGTPPAVILFHGTADENVRYDGGVGKKAIVKDSRKPVSYSVEKWVELNRCSKPPETEENGNIIIEKYGGCRAGSEVALYTIKGGGHAWPGGKRVFVIEDEPTAELSATDAMWDFFEKHTLNAGGSLEK